MQKSFNKSLLVLSVCGLLSGGTELLAMEKNPRKIVPGRGISVEYGTTEAQKQSIYCDFSGKEITDAHIKSLSEKLSDKVEVLLLSRCKKITKQCIPYILKFKNLKYLSLSQCGIKNFKTLFEGLNKTKIEALELFNCNVTDDDVKILTKQGNSTLTWLDVGDCKKLTVKSGEFFSSPDYFKKLKSLTVPQHIYAYSREWAIKATPTLDEDDNDREYYLRNETFSK